MKPEAQRIALAEFCGWERSDDEQFIPTWRHHDVEHHTTCLPDDLNAIHEAEKLLTYEQWSVYVEHLIGQDVPADCAYRGYQSIHATAAQRAEALLKTIGKWTE